jgi:hypothetical protein
MTDRILVALGTALALVVVGSACAQAPQQAVLSVPPPMAPAPEPAIAAGDWGLSEGWGAGADGQFWVSAEYQLGWFSGDRLPPLVTTSPPGTARLAAGAFGNPTTSILFGNEIANDDLRTGLRLGAGYWFTPARTVGLDMGFMMMESQATGFAASSDGSTILARPFRDVLNNLNDSLLVAFPGSSAGSVAASARSGDYYDFHLDLTENVLDTGWFRLDSLLGYRFYRYDEGVRIRHTISNNPSFAAGTVLTAEDDFTAINEFHGGDFGFRSHFSWEDVTLDLLTKLAVGSVNRDVKIVGGQETTAPGQTPVARAGGLLALGSNIGNHHSHDWTLLPELGATLGWQATRNVRVTLGYSVLWLDRIARATDQIDLGVNPNLLPSATQAATGPSRPGFLLSRSDVWFQTINFGVEFMY